MDEENEKIIALSHLYASWGWRVLPVRPGQKRPCIDDWTNQASTDRAQIEQWWRAYFVGAGVGVLTGPTSGICVVDVDDDRTERFGGDTLAGLVEKYGPLPETPMVLTPSGGTHRYYKWPGVGLRSKLGRWVDLLGEGDFVVAPVTPRNGKCYTWEHSLRPSQVPLAELPAWVLELAAVDLGPEAEDGPDLFADILSAAGFVLARVDNRGNKHWTRPGKDPREGTSLTVYPPPDHHATCWSENVPGLETGRPYGPHELARALGVSEPGDRQKAGEGDRSNGHGTDKDQDAKVPHIMLVPATTLRLRAVRWAWKSRVPLGGPTVLVGQEGLGKSTITVELTARATRGELEGDLEGPVSVVYVSVEDSEDEVAGPRLVAAGADLARVQLLRVDGHVGGLSLPADLAELVAEMRRTGARLLVLDPFTTHLGDNKMDAHKERDVRRALAPVAVAMADLGAACLGVMHWNKNPTTVALDRVLGSRAFTAAARSVLAVGEDLADPLARLLMLVKSNLGSLNVPVLGYRVEERWVDNPDGGFPIGTSGVVWTGEREGVRSSDLFGSPDSEEDRNLLAQAVELVESYLSDGAVDAKELDKVRQLAGISEITYRRARAQLHVIVEAVRDGSGRVVMWMVRLP